MKLIRRQRRYSRTSNKRFTPTDRTILLRPTVERRRRWYMAYYRRHFNVEEFKTYQDEHGRLHLRVHERSDLPEQLSPSDYLVIHNSDRHSFIWIHHSPEDSFGLIWPSML